MKTDTTPKVPTIRERAVKALYKPIHTYVEWAVEQGLYLPPDYAIDPTGWNEVLRKIQRAFRLSYEELEEDGELWKAKTEWKQFGEQDSDKIKELEKEIEEGFTLFGKYMFYLQDVIVDRGPSH